MCFPMYWEHSREKKQLRTVVKLLRILEVLRLRDTRSNEKAQWQSAEYKGVINMENGLTEMAPETTAVNIQQSVRQAL